MRLLVPLEILIFSIFLTFSSSASVNMRMIQKLDDLISQYSSDNTILRGASKELLIRETFLRNFYLRITFLAECYNLNKKIINKSYLHWPFLGYWHFQRLIIASSPKQETTIIFLIKFIIYASVPLMKIHRTSCVALGHICHCWSNIKIIYKFIRKFWHWWIISIKNAIYLSIRGIEIKCNSGLTIKRIGMDRSNIKINKQKLNAHRRYVGYDLRCILF